MIIAALCQWWNREGNKHDGIDIKNKSLIQYLFGCMRLFIPFIGVIRAHYFIVSDGYFQRIHR